VAHDEIMEGYPEDVAASPDSAMAGVAFQGGVSLLDLTRTPPRKHWRSDPGLYYGVAFSAGGKRFAASGAFGVVWVRETATGKLVREWKLPGCVYRVAFLPDGRHLVTLNGNGTAYVLRLANADGSEYPAGR